MEETFIIAKKYKVPKYCPDDCKLQDGIQGGFCHRCPILNCADSEEGDCMVHPDDYKVEWAKEWEQYFKTGKEPDLRFNITFKVIVAGGRNFDNYDMLVDSLNNLLKGKLPNVMIISGGANGVDKLGERYAKEHNLELKIFPANWNKYGKSAGYKRNQEMADNATALIAFWDGKSKGTKHMIDIAKKENLLLQVCDF